MQSGEFKKFPALGTRGLRGAKTFLLYISPQSSCPPSIHKFLESRTNVRSDYHMVHKGIIPQRPCSLNDDLFLAVGQTCNQGADHILSLQQSSCGRIVLNNIRDSNASPLALGRVHALHLTQSRPNA